MWLTAGGVAIGLAIAWLVSHFERWIDDGPIEVTISILVPYVAYLAAQGVHASGVLAVVSCGLLLSQRSAGLFSASVRIGLWSVWESLTFILNGLVFVLIGLQFPAIRNSIRSYHLSTILAYGAVFSVLLILLRLAWVFPGARFPISSVRGWGISRSSRRIRGRSLSSGGRACEAWFRWLLLLPFPLP